MRTVIVVGNFPGDRHVYAELAAETDLIVYGTQRRQPWLTYSPQPPHNCRWRSFEPVLRTTRSGHLLWLYRGLASALDADRPDVVHVVSEPWGMLAVQTAAWARKNPHATFVLHGCDRIWWHGSRPERLARRVLARHALRRADGYAAESRKALDRAVAGGLASGVPTSVIHTNPRSASLFRPSLDPDERLASRRSLGLPAEGIGVGFLGTFVPEKGPFVLLDALQMLRSDLVDGVWAVLAGMGPAEAEVEAKARGAGVVSLGTLSYPAEVADFYRSIDVYVIPSFRTADKEEQGPRSIIEAMLASCVVVGTDCGAIPEMVGDAGIIVAERDPHDLARGLKLGIAQARSDQGRRRARERALGLYSTDAVAARLIALWTNSLQHRQARDADVADVTASIEDFAR